MTDALARPEHHINLEFVEDASTLGQHVHGRLLTNEYAEELADRAERVGPPIKYWLEPGGKSLSKDGSHSPAIRTVLPAMVRDWVKGEAAANGMSVSKWTRRLIEREYHTAQKPR